MNNTILEINRYRWLFILIVITIAIGIFFRVNNINLKPYWHDEVYTSLYISGHTGKEVIKELSNKVITHENILKYQCPSTETNLFDTIKVLAQEDPQHPPLFYGLEAIWVKLFGCSITTMRSLSVLFSLCLLPSIYLLCQELFNKPLVSWIATALVSISPIHLRYAQEARQYSLFAFLTILSSWILLKAKKKNTFFLWICYAIVASLLLYCHLLSAFVLIGQIVFILALGKNLRKPNIVGFNSLNTTKIKIILRNYILALSIALISFYPWLKILIIGKKTAENKTGWLAQNIDFLSLIEKWSLNLSRIFISWNYDLNYWLIYLSIPLWILKYILFIIFLKKIITGSGYFYLA